MLVFDHPQTLGGHRDEHGLPAVAITAVRASADPAGPQVVELSNLGSDPVALAELELWNRERSIALPGELLAPGQRAAFVFGDPGAAALPVGVATFSLAADPERAFVGPMTALVLRVRDRRWVASYDPRTSAGTLPEGARAPAPGETAEWRVDASLLRALSTELLGVDLTPGQARPTWSPRGSFSDWADGFLVTDPGLVLWMAGSSNWTVRQ